MPPDPPRSITARAEGSHYIYLYLNTWAPLITISVYAPGYVWVNILTLLHIRG